MYHLIPREEKLQVVKFLWILNKAISYKFNHNEVTLARKFKGSLAYYEKMLLKMSL